MTSSERPTAPRKRPQDDDDGYSSLSGFFVRLSWVFAGPAILIGYLAWLLRADLSPTSPASLAFWGVVVLLVVARVVDVTHFAGETSTGARATLADAKRFALTIVGLSAAAWLGVHLD